jgi:hypothetical protein
MQHNPRTRTVTAGDVLAEAEFRRERVRQQREAAEAERRLLQATMQRMLATGEFVVDMTAERERAPTRVPSLAEVLPLPETARRPRPGRAPRVATNARRRRTNGSRTTSSGEDDGSSSSDDDLERARRRRAKARVRREEFERRLEAREFGCKCGTDPLEWESLCPRCWDGWSERLEPLRVPGFKTVGEIVARELARWSA